MAPTKHKIILIRGPQVESDYGDLKFIESVTQWDEVTDEELGILHNCQYRGNYMIVERNPKPTAPSQAHLRSPQDYIAEWRAQQAEAKKKREANKVRDEAKLLESKKRKLEKLKKELGEA